MHILKNPHSILLDKFQWVLIAYDSYNTILVSLDWFDESAGGLALAAVILVIAHCARLPCTIESTTDLIRAL